jgi:hypothetical protein
VGAPGEIPPRLERTKDIEMDIRDVLTRVGEGRRTLAIKDFNPHIEGDWRVLKQREVQEVVSIILDALQGDTDDRVEWDDKAGRLMYSTGCGCCDGEMGFEFRPDRSRHVPNHNLAQM